MNHDGFGFGVVGTGMIAGATAEAIAKSCNARVAAVSSRRLETAAGFASRFPGAAAVEGLDAMLRLPQVEAVYLAAPTVFREEMGLKVIAAGKHLLIEKPFVSHASALRLIQAAASRGVAFMDATHFVHHPRTRALQEERAGLIGEPRSLHTAFYFPLSDRSNIRFDPAQEPMTALGDMAWYSVRAAVEYLQPSGEILKAVTAPERDPATGAIVRASGLLAFADGKTATFDAGYTAGAVLMDLQLLGTGGVIEMDDFVLDWANSRAFQNPDQPAGWFLRSGMATGRQHQFLARPSETSQDTLMIQNFVTMAHSGNLSGGGGEQQRHTEATLQTQKFLDALWEAIHHPA